MLKTKFLLFLILLSPSLVAQTNTELINSIRNESSDSTIMKNISYFTDVYGPRLMGTPNYYNAINYAKEQLEEWGIETRFESFDDSHRGWSFSDFSIAMTSPSYSPISAIPLAHTNSTSGEVEGELVFISSLEEGYDLVGNLANKIIMLEGLYIPATWSSNEGISKRRYTNEELMEAKANNDPNNRLLGYHSRVSVQEVFSGRERTKERMAAFFTFLENEGALALIEPSIRPYGILNVDGNQAVPSFKLQSDIKPLASFVISNEHFGRLLRLNELGFQTKIKLSLTAEYFENPAYNVNLIAEIPGSDLENEIVVIGGHFDSWHAGTGAADNASGAAVLMETLRILKSINVTPRRTIRLILWGGHEQVYSGSSSYLEEHVGDLTSGVKKPEYSKISAYFNIDNGAGKFRGIYLMGNDKIEPHFAEYLQPFDGNNILTLQNANQTEHWLFDYFNIPSFQFIQDPLDYFPAIHHTNLDVYEYIPAEDQVFNAEYLAYLTLQVANARFMMPRKAHNYIQPSKEGNTTFFLDGYSEAERVTLVGNFNNWDMQGIPLYKIDGGWETKIDLPIGKYYYKFIVDGYWTNDPRTPESELAKDGKGHGGLTIIYVEE